MRHEGKYYRYSDPRYSISQSPLPEIAYRYVSQAIHLIDTADTGTNLGELQDVLAHVREELQTLLKCG